MYKSLRRNLTKVVNFAQKVQYPTWLANMVIVPKKNNKWRMCIDYTDLNKACPKDNYPFPRIDQLVDQYWDMKYCLF